MSILRNTPFHQDPLMGPIGSLHQGHLIISAHHCRHKGSDTPTQQRCQRRHCHDQHRNRTTTHLRQHHPSVSKLQVTTGKPSGQNLKDQQLVVVSSLLLVIFPNYQLTTTIIPYRKCLKPPTIVPLDDSVGYKHGLIVAFQKLLLHCITKSCSS